MAFGTQDDADDGERNQHDAPGGRHVGAAHHLHHHRAGDEALVRWTCRAQPTNPRTSCPRNHPPERDGRRPLLSGTARPSAGETELSPRCRPKPPRSPSPTCTSAATARCATSAWPRPWPRPARGPARLVCDRSAQVRKPQALQKTQNGKRQVIANRYHYQYRTSFRPHHASRHASASSAILTRPILPAAPAPCLRLAEPARRGQLSLLRGHKAVTIQHNGALYRLQATRLGKLILDQIVSSSWATPGPAPRSPRVVLASQRFNPRSQAFSRPQHKNRHSCRFFLLLKSASSAPFINRKSYLFL